METTKKLIGKLGEFGFGDSIIFNPDVFNCDLLAKVRSIIRENFTKTKTIQNRDLTQSYSIKHKIEDYSKRSQSPLYITNGLLIYAMYLEGYRVRRVRNNSLNAYFDVSTASIHKLQQ